jgi:GntR family transcriptional regulator / MocR family aminotransferase
VFEFPIALPAPGSGKLVQSLYAQLRDAVLDGRLQPGQRLPTSRAVAAAYCVSRNTAKAAYDLLYAEGYVVSSERSGTFVSEAALRPRQDHGADEGLAHERLAAQWRPAALPAQSRPPGACKYDFRVGVPELRAFPFGLWRRLATRELRSFERTPCAYELPHGRPRLRAAIARHVSFTRAVACGADDIQVTGGAQQAFDLLARILVTPEVTAVAVENPGYTAARAAFAAAGARIVPVPVDQEGLLVERIPADVKVIVVTPSHQFPLGVPMTMRRRGELLDFARRHGAVVIEDDYDSEFRFGGRPLDALQTLDRHQSVFYVGTFSKSVFPSLRIGYVVAPPWAQASLAAAKRTLDWHCETTFQDTLAAFIDEGHMARHVRKMRGLYEARRQLLLALMRSELGEWLAPLPSSAGLHLSATLSPAIDADALALTARAHGVGVLSLSMYHVGEVSHSGLVFGYGAIDVDAMRDGVRLLARACIEQSARR